MIIEINGFYSSKVKENETLSVFQSKINTKVYSLYEYIIGDELIAEYVFMTEKYKSGKWGWQFTSDAVEVCLFEGNEIFPLGKMNPALEQVVAQNYHVSFHDFSLINGYTGIHVLYKIHTDKTRRARTLKEIAERHNVSLEEIEKYFNTKDEKALMEFCTNQKEMLDFLKSTAK